MSADRKDENHQHGDRHTSVDAHYDYLRSAGYGADKARNWAERATDQLHKSMDGKGLVVRDGNPTAARSRFRVRFPWESDDAGLDLGTVGRTPST